VNGRGSTTTPWPQKLAADIDPAPVVLTIGDLPDGDPRAPPAPTYADGDEPVRWIYSTSDHDPKGVLHTDGT
jgi:hypothetical protein